MFRKRARSSAAIPGLIAGLLLVADAARAQCSADLNGDGRTDIGDISVLLHTFGCMGDCPCGDANGDGKVNTVDVALVVYELGCPNVGGDIGAQPPALGGIDFHVRPVTAPAQVSDLFTPEFAGGITHHVFDFDTLISIQGEYILALDLQCSTAGFTVFQHPAGGRVYPFVDDPNTTCGDCEARDFDTFSVNSQSFGSDGLFEFLSHETPTRLVAGWHSWFAPTAGDYWIQRLTLVTPPMVGLSIVEHTPGGAGVASLSLSAVTIGCDPETVARVDMDIYPCDRWTDLNGDWHIDLTDLSILLAHFGTPTGATPLDGDTDLDEDVDLTDLSRLLANFGLECS